MCCSHPVRRATKGALLEHRGMLNHMLAKIQDLGMNAADVLAQTAPVTFDISVWQALTGLYTQASTVVYGKQQQLDPAVFCQRLKQDGVTILEVVPLISPFCWSIWSKLRAIWHRCAYCC